MNQDLLITNLKQDEGYRPFLYDDENDRPIKPGYMVKGHPTAGYGFALDVAPLSEEESATILCSRATHIASQLFARLVWLPGHSEPRQRALANMAYTLGIEGLVSFTTFLRLMQLGEFDRAADDLKATKWAKEAGGRAVRIEALIRSG